MLILPAFLLASLVLLVPPGPTVDGHPLIPFTYPFRPFVLAPPISVRLLHLIHKQPLAIEIVNMTECNDGGSNLVTTQLLGNGTVQVNASTTIDNTTLLWVNISGGYHSNTSTFHSDVLVLRAGCSLPMNSSTNGTAAPPSCPLPVGQYNLNLAKVIPYWTLREGDYNATLRWIKNGTRIGCNNFFFTATRLCPPGGGHANSTRETC